MNLSSKKFKSINPGSLSSIMVSDNDLPYAIKQWKRTLKDSNVIQECYDRKFYKKPSESKRLLMNTAKYNQYKETLIGD